MWTIAKLIIGPADVLSDTWALINCWPRGRFSDIRLKKEEGTAKAISLFCDSHETDDSRDSIWPPRILYLGLKI